MHPEMPRSTIPSCIQYEKCLRDAQVMAQKKGSTLTDLAELTDIVNADTSTRATNQVLQSMMN